VNYANRQATLDLMRRIMQTADNALANELYAENADAERQGFDVEARVHITRQKAWSDKAEPNDIKITLTLTSIVPHIKEEGVE
jgi:23S rRNA A2030 N6-methylase RlmJ